MDHDFINEHLAPVAESDDFQKHLLDLYNKVYPSPTLYTQRQD